MTRTVPSLVCLALTATNAATAGAETASPFLTARTALLVFVGLLVTVLAIRVIRRGGKNTLT